MDTYGTTLTDRMNARALGQAVNLTELRKVLPSLEALCNEKIAASDAFKDAVTVAALTTGLLPGVLSQYVVAICTDTVAKKARSAGQLSLLFEECQ